MRKLCLIICLLFTAASPLTAQSVKERPLRISDQRSDKSQPAPLMVALHRAGSSPKSFKARSRLDAAARKAGFMLAYASPGGSDWTQSDLDYLATLIRSLRADPRVIDRPVLVVGHASGGEMALRLTCARPDLIAGVGVVSTKLSRGFPCSRGRPKPAIFVHGTADPIIPHDGGETTMSAAETIAFWGARNRCSGNLKISRVDRNRSDTTSVVQRRYTSCQATLAHYIVLGGGHGWHAGRSGRGGQLGPMSGEINAGDALVGFLRPLVGR